MVRIDWDPRALSMAILHLSPYAATEEARHHHHHFPSQSVTRDTEENGLCHSQSSPWRNSCILCLPRCVCSFRQLGTLRNIELHFFLAGLIDYLVGNSREAKILRDHIIFKIGKICSLKSVCNFRTLYFVVPMLNPDGVYLGNYRYLY